MANSQFPPYEGTEVIGFQFSNSTDPASLSDENSEVGKIWAATLKTYLDHPETGIVWWGIVHDAANKAKLFIELASAWKSITVAPATKDVYKFSSSDVARQTALSSTNDTVTAHLSFRFANSLNSSEVQQLDAVLKELDCAIMLSPGAVVASYSIGGWSSDHRSYSAAYRYLNANALRNFIQGDNKVRELLQILQSRASGGMELEFLETRVYKQGWQGSVTKTEPDNPTLSGFMAEAQAMFTF
ncbi:hypothetical protein FDENT_8933 [Fusarium denticulatum]|uniref:Uncharacterized protein n=1 Tax=Fusarium denticulatum TaxID=48507 RepID=A0A8H5U0L3_9HYPO|nr:hypothetical protein FDENT_8933 [Fusarium denticulatum]